MKRLWRWTDGRGSLIAEHETKADIDAYFPPYKLEPGDRIEEVVQLTPEEYEHLAKCEIELAVLKARVSTLSLLSPIVRPFGTKLVQCRSHGTGERISPPGGNFPLSRVEHLNNPSDLGRSGRTEIKVERQAPVPGPLHQGGQTLGGGDVENPGHTASTDGSQVPE